MGFRYPMVNEIQASESDLTSMDTYPLSIAPKGTYDSYDSHDTNDTDDANTSPQANPPTPKLGRPSLVWVPVQHSPTPYS